MSISAPDLAQLLTRQYGPLLHGKRLLTVLDYPSMAVLRKAIASKQIDLKLFSVPGRRGPFVLTVDAANWLVALRDTEAQAPVIGQLAGEPPNPKETRPMS